jgi:hypothetical protein
MRERVHKFYWSFAKKYLRFEDLNLSEIGQQIWVIVLILHGLSFLWRTSFLPLYLQENVSNPRLHAFLYKKLFDIILLKRQLTEAHHILTITFSLLILAKDLVHIFSYIHSRRKIDDYSRFSRTIVKICGFLTLMISTALTIPLTMIALQSLMHSSILYQIFAVLLLVQLPLGFVFNNLLCYDFKFRKTNSLQGRTRAFSLVQFSASFSIAFFATIVTKTHPSNTAVGMIHALIHLFFELIVAYLIIFRQCLGLFNKIGRLLVYIESVYLWECLLTFLSRFGAFQGFIFDYDYLSVFGIAAILTVFQRALEKAHINILSQDIYAASDPAIAILYFEILYDCFIQRNDPYYYYLLYASMATHTQNCRNPACLCFFSKVYYMQETKLIQIKNHIRMTDIAEEQRFGSSSFNRMGQSITLFNDLEFIKKLKMSQIDSLRLSPGESRASIAKSDGLSRFTNQARVIRPLTANKELYMISLSSQHRITKIISSMMFSLMSNPKMASSYQLAELTGSFLIYEYQNSVSALLNLYDFIYSKQIFGARSFLGIIPILNLIETAKSRLLAQSISAHMRASEEDKILLTDLGLVLDYRTRLQAIQIHIQKLLQLKLKFYNLLCLHDLDINFLTKLGNEIFERTENVREEFSRLMKINNLSFEMIKRLGAFEFGVLEEKKPSIEYLTCVRDAANLRSRVHSLHSVSSDWRPMVKQKDFNYYESEHTVVFVNQVGNSFRFTHFTSNAPDLFQTTADRLTNANINHTMPDVIAKVHDRFVLDYFNKNEMKRIGPIHSVLKTYSKLKNNVANDYMSVEILIKFEFIFAEDFYIAAMFIKKKQNSYPLLYSNQNGTIFATNSTVSFIYQGGKVTLLFKFFKQGKFQGCIGFSAVSKTLFALLPTI